LRGDGVGRYFTHYRTHARDADDKHQPVSENSKDEVGDRSGGNDGGALANGFIVERVWRISGATGSTRSSSILT
jgi:hypothetical protein